MGGRHMVPGGLNVHLLIIKENICSKDFQKFAFDARRE
jgi:hypothetical protein